MTSKPFITISAKDVFDEIKGLKGEVGKLGEEVIKLNNLKKEVEWHRKWIYSLTGAFSTGFLFIISFLLRR